MKTFVAFFAGSAIFGVVTGVAYWLIAHEEATGTVLLGCMAAALAFTAAYAVIAEKNADLPGDDPQETPERAAGEALGIFTTHSAWPILVAISSLAMLVGMLWSPLIGFSGLAALLLCLWRLGAESARV
ncbi:MAG TPA: cytochrome c oxidase subunit 4 [Candidatus Baltobacteraceae bacterium]|jgi:hypothetical protein